MILSPCIRILGLAILAILNLKTMKYTIALLLLLVTPCLGFSQATTENKEEVSVKRQKKTDARQQINQLQGGALLIRLETKSKVINALKKSGKESQAKIIEKMQAEYNMTIVRAFRAAFGFCPVYFFYSEHSEAVRAKSFAKVRFLTYDLKADGSVKFAGGNFFTAEFGTIEGDGGNDVDEGDTKQNDKSKEGVSEYKGGVSMGFGALLIKDDQFVQLSRPFPFYVRTFDSLPTKRSPKKVVELMNEKLQEFYARK